MLIREIVGTWRPSAAVLMAAATSALLTAACAPAPPVATVVSSSPTVAPTPATVAPTSPVEFVAPEVGEEVAPIPAETPAEESNIDVPFVPAFDASVQPAPGTPGDLASACDDRLGFCASYPEGWIFSFARHRHAFEVVLESLSFDPRGVEDAHANGRYFGFVREIETVETDAHVLHVDIAHMLHGDEAGRAAVEDRVIDAPAELSNDYYIRNLDTATVRYQLSITATVVLLVPSGGPTLRTTRVKELLPLYRASVPKEQRWMRDAPYWFTVEGGVVRRLVMQYLP